MLDNQNVTPQCDVTPRCDVTPQCNAVANSQVNTSHSEVTGDSNVSECQIVEYILTLENPDLENSHRDEEVNSHIIKPADNRKMEILVDDQLLVSKMKIKDECDKDIPNLHFRASCSTKHHLRCPVCHQNLVWKLRRNIHTEGRCAELIYKTKCDGRVSNVVEESETGAETESEKKSDTESEIENAVESQAEAATVIETGSDAESGIGIEVESKPESETGIEEQIKVESEREKKSEAALENKATECDRKVSEIENISNARREAMRIMFNVEKVSETIQEQGIVVESTSDDNNLHKSDEISKHESVDSKSVEQKIETNM